MSERYLEFICDARSLERGLDPRAEVFDAIANYEELTAFYDSCPECESFPKEEYFSGGWYHRWTDYVIYEDGCIAARAGIWQLEGELWEVAGVITRPEYRGKGYSTRLAAHCAAMILLQGKIPFLSTAESNTAMIAAAEKAGFYRKEP